MNKIYPALKQVFSIWITSEEIYKYLNVQELASLCVVIESFAALPRDYLLRKYRIRNELDIFCHTLIRVVKRLSLIDKFHVES